MTSPIQYGTQPFVVPAGTLPFRTVVPVTDPNGTVRTSDIDDIIDIQPEFNDYNFIYKVGSPPEVSEIKHVIINKSVNAKIQVNIEVPTFINVFPSHVLIFDADASGEVTFKLNEDNVRYKSLSLTRSYEELVKFTVIILSSTRPIYVRN